MQLNHLRYFITAAQMESISNAARYHMIPQPAMSKTISGLEKELGVKLFKRAGRKVKLTKDGHYLLQQAQRSLQILDAAAEHLKHQETVYQIRVAINAGTDLFLDMIGLYMTNHPNTRFSILQHYPDTIDPTAYDLMFGSEMYAAQDLVPTFLFSERFMLAVPAGHPLVSLPEVSLENLNAEKLIAFKDSFRYQRQLMSVYEKYDFEPEIAVEVDNGLTMVKMVESGFGVTIVPEFTWGKMASGRQIRMIPFREADFFQSMYIYTKRQTALPPASEQFLQFCREYFIHPLSVRTI